MKTRLISLALLVVLHLFSSPVWADTFTEKIRQFIYRDPSTYFIHINDMLGEGAGYFDADPRYLPHEMNCTTWYQTAIATALSQDKEQVPEWLDKIRYFRGVVGFSTRIHFTDNTARMTSSLFEPVVFEGVRPQSKLVHLNYPHFRSQHNYTCPLYEEKFKESAITYYLGNDFLKQSEILADGVYLVYPVASDRYIAAFGQSSGPMGLVHGLLLDIDSSKFGIQRAMVSHASITRKTVVTKPLAEYIHSPATQNFLGYTLWKINSEWQSQKPTGAETKEIEHLLQCEKNIMVD